MGQLIHPKELAPLRKKHAEKSIVFTNGCFDILHIGHVQYLKKARSLGDLLVLGLNSDASVKSLKGPNRPIQNELDRAEILAALACVDFVVIFDDPTPLELIQELSPNILVKGGDWPVDKIVGADWVKKKGGQVKSLAFIDERSTTSIIERILSLPKDSAKI